MLRGFIVGILVSIFFTQLTVAGEISGTGTTAASSGVEAGAKSPKLDATTLVGRTDSEVLATLGKPMGKLKTAAGALWLYSDWKIQFDSQNHVLKVERDTPVRAAALDPQWAARLNAADKAARERVAAEEAAKIRVRTAVEGGTVRVISNGGASVDLPSLLVEGKVTVVDFYAHWCGPCMKLAPALEEMIKKDPDLVLIKIDIVNWGTPVAKQFALDSIPHVRVYDRKKQQTGYATSSLNTVEQNVKRAKGS